MKKTILSMLAVAFMLGHAGNTQAQTAEDIEAIKKLCGCFSVTFNYAETFTNDTLKKHYAGPMDLRGVVEYAYPIEEKPGKIVIQHLLVIPDGKGTVIKHWREDWEYEQTERWVFEGNRQWKKVRVPLSEVKGQWTQSVWEVTDEPRYTGSSSWLRANNEVFWLNTADAPLPRREYTSRRDYHVMRRTNRIIVSETGYLHEQDNKKIIRQAGVRDSLLAEEKGYNEYVRLPEEACAGAKEFWTASQDAFWADVRAVWAENMDQADRITTSLRVDDKLLYVALDELWNSQPAASSRKAAIRKLLSKYIKLE